MASDRELRKIFDSPQAPPQQSHFGKQKVCNVTNDLSCSWSWPIATAAAAEAQYSSSFLLYTAASSRGRTSRYQPERGLLQFVQLCWWWLLELRRERHYSNVTVVHPWRYKCVDECRRRLRGEHPPNKSESTKMVEANRTDVDDMLFKAKYVHQGRFVQIC